MNKHFLISLMEWSCQPNLILYLHFNNFDRHGHILVRAVYLLIAQDRNIKYYRNLTYIYIYIYIYSF